MPENLDPLSILTTVCCLSLCLAAFVAPIVWIAYSSRRRQRGVVAAWEPLARRYGLTLEQIGPAKRPLISGTYQNRRITVSYGVPSNSPDSDNRRLYTTIQLEVKIPGAHWLNIRRLGIAEKVTKAVSMQVTPTGDEDFDMQFLVVSQPKETAVRLLGNNPEARRILSSLTPGWFGVALYKQSLSYEEEGVITDEDRMQSLFDRMSDLADRFEGKAIMLE